MYKSTQEVPQCEVGKACLYLKEALLLSIMRGYRVRLGKSWSGQGFSERGTRRSHQTLQSSWVTALFVQLVAPFLETTGALVQRDRQMGT